MVTNGPNSYLPTYESLNDIDLGISGKRRDILATTLGICVIQSGTRFLRSIVPFSLSYKHS